METRTVRETTIMLPHLDEEALDEVTSLDRDRLTDITYTGAQLRELSLSGTTLTSGRITGLTAQRACLDQVTLSSVEFADCNLSNLRMTGSKLSRVVFTDCKLLGAVIDDVTLDSVLFERCRLDYAHLSRIRAAGPVVFSSCSLREASVSRADLTGATLNACDLYRTEFDGGVYRGFDLRGNDLAGVRGVSCLRQVTLDRSQLPGLAQAVAADLEILVAEDQA
ncbi:pentapeptide repeat-containing protein [Microbispora sp. RL4-1S]|uniref:Pentapeptide repeat-containing protein n=1 Tax=Microbispora oryzae TaxID=2806554 RepID=A0A940WF65_9ACTN|nr:pentapeptide repeat-containing protein [Microbispora oryzae]MBP2704356.1 pentapeptide repeat-containing protein [Microbispora oryzae]